ncbi:MAG: hypothetical protein J0L99_01545 [Chitinophagales bacterium]|nr:hypothetical protein [Chitinophagales bacterium]
MQFRNRLLIGIAAAAITFGTLFAFFGPQYYGHLRQRHAQHGWHGHHGCGQQEGSWQQHCAPPADSTGRQGQ